MTNHQSKIVVTGIGTFSSIGKNVEETLNSLKTGKHGIGKMKYLNSVHKDEIPVAEIKMSDEELVEWIQHPNPSGITRASLIGMAAAKEALLDSGIDLNDGLRTGLISSSTVGGMDKTEIYFLSYLGDNADPTFLNSNDPGAGTENMADWLGIKDYISTISTACSSAANCIMYGARLIKNGVIDRAVVGGTDCLTKFTLNGFNTLKILDRQPCRPMDDSRTGLNLGEGAGYLVIESEKAAQGKKIHATLSGYGNTNDAFHQTASSPQGDGAYNAMKKALSISGLQPSDIDYINLHGTGTENNDLSEGRAVSRLFEGCLPKMSSTKSFTGHTLAAAGGLEAVYSILAIQNKMIFPNLRYQNRIEDLTLEPVSELMEDTEINHIVSNSFGFGGNNTALVFSKYK